MTQKQNVLGAQKIRPFDILILLIGLIGLSSAPIFIRISEQEIGPFATIFDRVCIASAILWAAHATAQVSNFKTPQSKNNQRTALTPTLLLFLSLSGACGAITLVLWAWSCQQTSIANSNLLHNLTPIFVVLGSYLFLGQSFNLPFLGCLLLTVIGSALILIQDWHASHNLGDLAAIMSAIAYAGSFLLNERIRRTLDTTSLLRWRNLFMSVWILPFVILYEPKILPDSLLGYGVVLSLAIFCGIIAQGILVLYLKKLPASFMSLLTLLDPPLAALLASIFLSEHMSFSNYFYFAMVLAGIYLCKNSLNSSKSFSKACTSESK